VSLPNRDRLTMGTKPLKTRDLILSLSKDEAKISRFFSSLLCRGKIPAVTPSPPLFRLCASVNPRIWNIFNGLLRVPFPPKI
jgi:hypothetical protein